MRLRPWVVTSVAAACAAAAVTVVVTTSEPTTARPELFWILWAALGMGVWSLIATLLLWLRQPLTRVVWITSAFTLIGVGAIVARRILG